MEWHNVQKCQMINLSCTCSDNINSERERDWTLFAFYFLQIFTMLTLKCPHLSAELFVCANQNDSFGVTLIILLHFSPSSSSSSFSSSPLRGCRTVRSWALTPEKLPRSSRGQSWKVTVQGFSLSFLVTSAFLSPRKLPPDSMTERAHLG